MMGLSSKSTTDQVLLAAQNLRFRYAARQVLDGVTFNIDRGEFVGLVGPNGSGKSTLIQLLTRVLALEDGEVWLEGTALSTLKPAALAARVAVVPQETSMEFDFSVFDVVMMGRTPHLGPLGRESPRDREVVREAMALLETTDLADRSIRTLSGGERQRVIVARAIAQEPDLLLLDEPTSHLDINHQADLLSLVLGLCRDRQIGVLAVLHDLNLATAYADRVMILHRGRIAADGAPGDVITTESVLEAFGARVLVIPHPVTGRPAVLLQAHYPAQERM